MTHEIVATLDITIHNYYDHAYTQTFPTIISKWWPIFCGTLHHRKIFLGAWGGGDRCAKVIWLSVLVNCWDKLLPTSFSCLSPCVNVGCRVLVPSVCVTILRQIAGLSPFSWAQGCHLLLPIPHPQLHPPIAWQSTLYLLQSHVQPKTSVV